MLVKLLCECVDQGCFAAASGTFDDQDRVAEAARGAAVQVSRH